MEISGWDWKNFTTWRTALHTNWGSNSCYRTVHGIQLNTTHSVWRVNHNITESMSEGIPETLTMSWIMVIAKVLESSMEWIFPPSIVTTIVVVRTIVPPTGEVDGGTTTASTSTPTVLKRTKAQTFTTTANGLIFCHPEWCWDGRSRREAPRSEEKTLKTNQLNVFSVVFSYNTKLNSYAWSVSLLFL